MTKNYIHELRRMEACTSKKEVIHCMRGLSARTHLQQFTVAEATILKDKYVAKYTDFGLPLKLNLY